MHKYAYMGPTLHVAFVYKIMVKSQAYSAKSIGNWRIMKLLFVLLWYKNDFTCNTIKRVQMKEIFLLITRKHFHVNQNTLIFSEISKYFQTLYSSKFENSCFKLCKFIVYLKIEIKRIT